MGTRDELKKSFNRHFRKSKDLNLPETIVRIEQGKYKNGTNIKTLTGINVEEVEDSAFEGCEELTSVELEKVTKIGENAFKGCKKLERLEIPEIETIGQGAFEGCDNINHVVINKIEDFYKIWDALTNISRDKVKAYMKNGEEVKYTKTIIDEENVLHLDNIVSVDQEKLNLDDMKKAKAIKGPHLKQIYDNVFENFEDLEYIDLPELEIIGKGAFKGCKRLEQLNIPEVKEIEADSFEDCDNIKTMFIKDKERCYMIWNALPINVREEVNIYTGGDKINDRWSPWIERYEDETIYLRDIVIVIKGNMLDDYKDRVEKIVGEEVRQIDNNAFKCFGQLKAIDFQKLETIMDGAFEECYEMENIFIGKEDICEKIFNVLPSSIKRKVSIYIGKDTTGEKWSTNFIDLSGFIKNNGKIITLPGEFVAIESNFFDEYKDVVEKIEASGARIIENNAFEGCKKLRYIYCQNVNEIGREAFKGCTVLEYLDIQKVETVDSNAFDGCERKMNIYVEEEKNGEAIWNSLSEDMRKKVNIIMIGKGMFSSYNDIAKYTSDGGEIFNLEGVCDMTYLGILNLFKRYKDKVKEINAPEVKKIDRNMFKDYQYLKSVNFPEAIEIESEAFLNCTNLSNVNIMKAEVIGENVFAGCDNLRELKVKNEEIHSRLLNEVKDDVTFIVTE